MVKLHRDVKWLFTDRLCIVNLRWVRQNHSCNFISFVRGFQWSFYDIVSAHTSFCNQLATLLYGVAILRQCLQTHLQEQFAGLLPCIDNEIKEYAFNSLHVVTERNPHDSLGWSILDYLNLQKGQGISESQNDLVAWPAQKYRTGRSLYYAAHVGHYWSVFLNNEPQEVKEHSIFFILSDLKFQERRMLHKSVQIYEEIINQACNHGKPRFSFWSLAVNAMHIVTNFDLVNYKILLSEHAFL